MKPELEAGSGGSARRPAWVGALLFLILVGLIVLIVYQLRGRRPLHTRGESASRDQSPALQKIDESLSSLKKQIEGEPRLDVKEALAQRPPPATQPAPVAATSPAQAVGTEPAAEPLVKRVAAGPAGTSESTNLPISIEGAPVPLPTLGGVIWHPSKPLAIVNGTLMGLNEKSGPYTLIEIGKERVVFLDGMGARRTVRLYTE